MCLAFLLSARFEKFFVRRSVENRCFLKDVEMKNGKLFEKSRLIA